MKTLTARRAKEGLLESHFIGALTALGEMKFDGLTVAW
jgi:hypothetical protein